MEKVTEQLKLSHKLTPEDVARLGRLEWKCVWLQIETSLKWITYRYKNFINNVAFEFRLVI